MSPCLHQKPTRESTPDPTPPTHPRGVSRPTIQHHNSSFVITRQWRPHTSPGILGARTPRPHHNSSFNYPPTATPYKPRHPGSADASSASHTRGSRRRPNRCRRHRRNRRSPTGRARRRRACRARRCRRSTPRARCAHDRRPRMSGYPGMQEASLVGGDERSLGRQAYAHATGAARRVAPSPPCVAPRTHPRSVLS